MNLKESFAEFPGMLAVIAHLEKKPPKTELAGSVGTSFRDPKTGGPLLETLSLESLERVAEQMLDNPPVREWMRGMDSAHLGLADSLTKLENGTLESKPPVSGLEKATLRDGFRN